MIMAYCTQMYGTRCSTSLDERFDRLCDSNILGPSRLEVKSVEVAANIIFDVTCYFFLISDGRLRPEGEEGDAPPLQIRLPARENSDRTGPGELDPNIAVQFSMVT